MTFYYYIFWLIFLISIFSGWSFQLFLVYLVLSDGLMWSWAVVRGQRKKTTYVPLLASWVWKYQTQCDFSVGWEVVGNPCCCCFPDLEGSASFFLHLFKFVFSCLFTKILGALHRAKWGGMSLWHGIGIINLHYSFLAFYAKPYNLVANMIMLMFWYFLRHIFRIQTPNILNFEQVQTF